MVGEKMNHVFTILPSALDANTQAFLS